MLRMMRTEPLETGALNTRYGMIALDLDGTLIGPDGSISAPNRRAIERAREAGIRVTVCTGRGFVECERFLSVIGQKDPVIVAGGSILSCPTTRRTIHRFAIDQSVVVRAVESRAAEAERVRSARLD